MNDALAKFDTSNWNTIFDPETQEFAVSALENGNVLYFPNLSFALESHEIPFLTSAILDEKSKNISYNLSKNTLRGVAEGQQLEPLKAMLHRYVVSTTQFLKHLIPHYTPHLIQAKTSFRPVEIEGRKTSPTKDDKRIHIDAFPSNPTGGNRLLRIFTNIHPSRPRVWRIGEPFEQVAQKFLPKTSAPVWGVSKVLKALGITKSYRTPYDHYMLQIHDLMKMDENYQKDVKFQEVLFHPGETWIAFSDQVSHAALSGQYLLEQTFNLSTQDLFDPAKSPLKILEKFLKKQLI